MPTTKKINRSILAWCVTCGDVTKWTAMINTGKFNGHSVCRTCETHHRVCCPKLEVIDDGS